MRAVGLDISSHCGWAAWDGHRPAPLLGVKHVVGWQYDIESMLELWRNWLAHFFEAHNPEVVFIEAWMLPQHGDAATVEKQVALTSFTRWACKVSGRKVAMVHAASWRKSFLGSGRGTTDEFKRRALGACAALGWNAADHNAAEAAGVLHHGLDMVAGIKTPWRDAHLFYVQTGKPSR